MNNNLMTKDLEAQKSVSTCESYICENVSVCRCVPVCVRWVMEAAENNWVIMFH